MEKIYEPLDEGIKEVVTLLRKNGINTISSCQGGVGHSFSMPTVILDFDGLGNAVDVLNENGYSNYYAMKCLAYFSHTGKADMKNSYSKIEFITCPLPDPIVK